MSSGRLSVAALPLLGLLAIEPAAPLAGPPADAAAEMLAAADAVRTSGRHGISRLRVSRTGSAGEADEIELYVGDDERVLAVFRSGRQRGRRLLVADGATWLIVPGTRHPIAVAGQHRLAGDLAIADLAGAPLASRYMATLRPAPEAIDGVPCRVLDLAVRLPGGAHPSAVLWMGAEDALPRRLVLRLPSGRDGREVVFAAYRTQSGRKVVERLVLRDLVRGGAATLVEFIAYEPREIDPSIFTLQGARSVP